MSRAGRTLVTAAVVGWLSFICIDPVRAGDDKVEHVFGTAPRDDDAAAASAA